MSEPDLSALPAEFRAALDELKQIVQATGDNFYVLVQAPDWARAAVVKNWLSPPADVAERYPAYVKALADLAQALENAA